MQSTKSGSHSGTCSRPPPTHTNSGSGKEGLRGIQQVGSAWSPSPLVPVVGLLTLRLAWSPAPPQPAGACSLLQPLRPRRPSASGLRQEKGKKLGLSGELPASKRARRRFNAACVPEKPRAVFGSHHVGQREPQGTCRAHSRPGSGASRRQPRHLRPDWSSPASPPPGAQFLALLGACVQFAG